MNFVRDFFGNYILMCAVCGWFTAQILKFIVSLFRKEKLNYLTLLFSSGGMPSSHSAMVCAMMTVIGFHEGFASSVFALAFCFAGVTMYDAAGVRRSTGKNAAVINKMLDELVHSGFVLNEERLKELVGHTPIQVMAGALLGIFIGTLIA